MFKQLTKFKTFNTFQTFSVPSRFSSLAPPLLKKQCRDFKAVGEKVLPKSSEFKKVLNNIAENSVKSLSKDLSRGFKGPKNLDANPFDSHVRLINTVLNIIINEKKETSELISRKTIKDTAEKITTNTFMAELLMQPKMLESKPRTVFELRIHECISPTNFIFCFKADEREEMMKKLK